MKKEVKDFRETVAWLGFNKNTGDRGALPVVFALVTIFLMLNCVYFMIEHRDELEKIVLVIKGLIIYLMNFIYLLTLFLNWEKFNALLRANEEGLYQNTNTKTELKSNYQEAFDENINQVITVWYYGLNGYSLIEVITPVLVILYRMYEHGINNLTVSMVYVSIPFYYPKNNETIMVYLCFYAIQSLFYIIAANHAFVVMTSSFTGMQLIKWELQSLQKMVKDVDCITSNNKLHMKNINTNDVERVRTEAMKSFLISFIRRHCNIYRKVNDVTGGLQLAAFSNNTGFSILLCTTIYSIVKIHNTGVAQGVFFCCLLIFCLYCYGMIGETVSTEDENLRSALYETSWIEKPEWFKRSLQIIMVRTNRPIEIKTFRLVVLNLKTFLRAVQAVYSYYNLLSNFN